MARRFIGSHLDDFATACVRLVSRARAGRLLRLKLTAVLVYVLSLLQRNRHFVRTVEEIARQNLLPLSK